MGWLFLKILFSTQLCFVLPPPQCVHIDILPFLPFCPKNTPLLIQHTSRSCRRSSPPFLHNLPFPVVLISILAGVQLVQEPATKGPSGGRFWVSWLSFLLRVEHEIVWTLESRQIMHRGHLVLVDQRFRVCSTFGLLIEGSGEFAELLVVI